VAFKVPRAELNLLRTLVRQGEAHNETLEMLYAGCGRKVVHVHVLKLRRILAGVTDEVRIVNVFDWGYRIEISE
jgi:DNA-binding winged helix-turn-helix (wHTH) protein